LLVQSIINTLESAVADRSAQNLGGYVKDFDVLFTRSNVECLEAMHEGVFAFFAFHPQLDTAIADYLRLGSLADDTGQHVFALFTLDMPANTPIHLATASSPWLSLTSPSASPVTLIRNLFPTGALPTLPSVVFLERLSITANPVAVSLAGLTTPADVRTRCARVCDLASRAYLRKPLPGTFATSFSTLLAADGLEYGRGEPTSIFEWFIKTVRFVHANAGTIVSVVKLF
jgi:hypothetical protein